MAVETYAKVREGAARAAEERGQARETQTDSHATQNVADSASWWM